MIQLLNIDTATDICSVSVSRDDQVLCYRDLNEGYSHAEKLGDLINEILEEENLNYSDLNAIAVNIGPGSYTGLRIGVSTVKGLAYAMKIPVIGINSLEALANHPHLQASTDDIIVPMIDARRMEVYTATYQNGSLIDDLRSLVLEESSLDHLGHKTIHVLGNGAAKTKELFAAKENVIIHQDLLSTSRGIVQPSVRKYKEKTFEDTAYFEPYYLKEFVAGKPKKRF